MLTFWQVFEIHVLKLLQSVDDVRSQIEASTPEVLGRAVLCFPRVVPGVVGIMSAPYWLGLRMMGCVRMLGPCIMGLGRV
jgi:hypothetical protein